MNDDSSNKMPNIFSGSFYARQPNSQTRSATPPTKQDRHTHWKQVKMVQRTPSIPNRFIHFLHFEMLQKCTVHKPKVWYWFIHAEACWFMKLRSRFVFKSIYARYSTQLNPLERDKDYVRVESSVSDEDGSCIYLIAVPFHMFNVNNLLLIHRFACFPPRNAPILSN